ncbi:alpha/beta hydrolase [Nocardia brasiliensis]
MIPIFPISFRRPRSNRKVISILVLSFALLSGSMNVMICPIARAIDHEISAVSSREAEVVVDSQAMGRKIRVKVLLPEDQQAARPSMYFLDGNDAEWGDSGWLLSSDIKKFFDKIPVNVVLPIGGPGSFYTDWQRQDPGLGRNAWESFLTKELPPVIDQNFSGNGRNGIAGLSSGGYAAMTLAFRNPNLFSAVGSYSGPLCGGARGQEIIRTAVSKKGGNADNMWGEDRDPDWAAHDPTKHADKLRGKAIFLAAGSGVPGPDDAEQGLVDIPAGIVLERVARECTEGFAAVLSRTGVTANVKYQPVGIHTWPVFQQSMHDSWPTLRAGLGI